jgi:hypothetical protein
MTDLIVRDLNIQGTNFAGDWDQSQEFDAGLRFLGPLGLLVQDVNIDAVYGDGLQVTYGGGQPRDVTFRRVTISRNGRQGIGVNSGNGLLIDDVTIVGSRRSGIDLEPFSDKLLLQNVEIRNSRITSRLLAIAGGGQGRVNNVWIHDNVIPRSGIPLILSQMGTAGTRENWIIERNVALFDLGSPAAALKFVGTTNVVVRNNTFPFAVNREMWAVDLRAGSSATVADNWFQGARADYVATSDGSTWSGGNNSTSMIAPSPVPWARPVVTTPAPPSGPSEPINVNTAPVAGSGQADAQHLTSARTMARNRLRFNVREPVAHGRWLRATARPTAALALEPSARVSLQFRVNQRHRWVTVASTIARPSGAFTFRHRARAEASGYWRATARSGGRVDVSRSDHVKVR